MGEDNKSALVPRLRFPEFRDDWGLVTVGDFFDFTDKPEKTTTFDKDRVLTVKLRANGVVKNEKTTLTGGANYFNRKAGQFVFSKIDLLNGAFGVVPDMLDRFASSSDVPAYSFNAEQSSTFFVNWLKANYEQLEIERTGTSSTLKRVSPEKFLALEVSAPTLAEQQKIADCLSSLDELITEEIQKLGALKTHKTGLMQQLFPREGKTLPRLRFPEFRETGEWEACSLGDVIEEYREKSSYQDQYEVLTSARSGLVRQRDYYDNDRITERDNVGFNVIPPNYLTYRSRSDDRRFYFNENTLGITGIISTYYPVFRIVGGSNKFYIELLSHHAELVGKHSVGTSQTVLSLNELRRIKLPIPTEPEQLRVAGCLSSLDDLISAQSQKIDALKAHRKGLLQQLFPVPGEVQA